MAGVACTDTPEHVQYIVKKYYLGGIMFDAKLGKAPRDHIKKLIQAARDSNPTIIIGFDAEYGIAQRCSDAQPYPYARELGTKNDLTYTYNTAYAIGTEAKNIGVDIVFAPVLDVDTNPNNPVIGKRSFGATPEQVITHGTAFINGLLAAGVIPCAKHFPGHGDTHIDSHIGLPAVTHSREHLDLVELAPFKTLHTICPAFMVAHLLVPELDPQNPTSLSHTVTTKLLRDNWHYTGVIITDALNMGALTTHYTQEEIALTACAAGVDILLYPEDIEKAYQAILNAVLTGKISLEIIDQKIARIKQLTIRT